MTNLPPNYLQERLNMIEKLELGAQRGPKSLAAVKAEVSQTRQMYKDAQMEINMIAPINDTSYGITSTHIVHQLICMGHKLNLFPIGQPNCHKRHAESIRTALKNSDTFSIYAPCIRLWHQFDMSMFVGKHVHIGFPIFELDTFTDKEKQHLRSCDCLYVCSKWAENVIYDNLYPWELTVIHQHPTTVRVVPLGVDTEIFTPIISKRKPTIFLNVGKWEVRKGHDILPYLFNTAFNEDDNVELWMMCSNPFLSPEETASWESKYKNTKMGHKVRFIPRVETDEQVAEIMRQADCGVFPSRAEGWNLEALEMMACGKDVIITNYSAHTEFCTQENSCLVPIDSVESAFDGKWFFNQGNWAKIGEYEVECFIAHLIQVHRNKQSGGLTLNEAGIETARKFTWRNTAETIVSHLS